jgi:hypothetical protein
VAIAEGVTNLMTVINFVSSNGVGHLVRFTTTEVAIWDGSSWNSVMSVDSLGLVVSPTFAGTGQQTHQGSGSAAITLSVSGAGWTTVTGTGSVATAPTFTGTGIRGLLGNGSFTVQPVLAGTGTIT